MATKTRYSYSGWTFPVDDMLVQTSCWCGIRLAIPQNLYDWMHEDSARSCYCPAGHKFVFSEGLKQELEAERRRSGRLVAELDQTEARRKAQKAATSRARNQRDKIATRIKNGVCPCCGRSFTNVRLHMTKMHSDFDPAAEDAEVT